MCVLRSLFLRFRTTMNVFKILEYISIFLFFILEPNAVRAQSSQSAGSRGSGLPMRARPQGLSSGGRRVQGRQKSFDNYRRNRNWVPPMEPYIRPAVRPTMSAREKPFSLRMKQRSFTHGAFGTRGRGGLSSGRGGFSSGRGGLSSGRGGFSSGRGGFSSGRGGFSSGRSEFSSGRGRSPSGRGGFSSGRGGTGGRGSFSSGRGGVSSGPRE